MSSAEHYIVHLILNNLLFLEQLILHSSTRCILLLWGTLCIYFSSTNMFPNRYWKIFNRDKKLSKKIWTVQIHYFSPTSIFSPTPSQEAWDATCAAAELLFRQTVLRTNPRKTQQEWQHPLFRTGTFHCGCYSPVSRCAFQLSTVSIGDRCECAPSSHPPSHPPLDRSPGRKGKGRHGLCQHFPTPDKQQPGNTGNAIKCTCLTAHQWKLTDELYNAKLATISL